MSSSLLDEIEEILLFFLGEDVTLSELKPSGVTLLVIFFAITSDPAFLFLGAVFLLN